MKLFSTLVLFLALVFPSYNAIAQEMDKDAMMKAYQDAMTPGPQHKMLAEMVGDWEGDITMWMDPSQPPQKSKGTTKYEAIFDGRYIVGHYTGNMMGMPFAGMDITGYDNTKKVFFSSWIDNMGTGMMNLEGTYDDANQTFNYSGEMLDPMGNKMKVREVLTVTDKDHTKFEMFMDMGGGEMKSMEILYTRK